MRPGVTRSGEDPPKVTVGNDTAHAPRGTPDSASLADLLGAVLAAEGIPGGAEASLHLVDESGMRELNSQHMGVDGATDVLSFPLDGPGVSGQPGVPQLVGDVVLCPEVAARNATTHAGSLVDECNLLVVHGGLHLCGWDHATDAERDSMWARERELMVALGVEPSGDPWGAA